MILFVFFLISEIFYYPINIERAVTIDNSNKVRSTFQYFLITTISKKIFESQDPSPNNLHHGISTRKVIFVT